jgi:hypothetical protein
MYMVHAATPQHLWSWESFPTGEEAIARAERIVADGAARRADVYAVDHAQTTDAAKAVIELGAAVCVLSKGVKGER